MLLKRVAEYILKNCGKYAQESPCGTKCCIVGNALRLAEPKIFKYLSKVYSGNFNKLLKSPDYEFKYGWEEEGKKILDLTDSQFDKLCRSQYVGWPTKFLQAYEKGEEAEDPKLIAKAGYDRIMHFIKTGK